MRRLPHMRRDRRHIGKPFERRLEVQPGSADEDRQPAPFSHAHNGSVRIPKPMGDRITLRGMDMTIEKMRHARFILRARPRRKNSQLLIDLRCIGIDENAFETLGEFKRKCRLAARCRPCNKDRS